MRNGAGTRPPSSSGVSGYGWRRAWAGGGIEALRSRGPVSREKLSGQQWARLEAELRKGPLAHGFAGDQRWTLGRIKTLIGKLFHVGYTVEGTWRLMRRHDGGFGRRHSRGRSGRWHKPTWGRSSA